MAVGTAKLEGETALVAGGTRNIGLAIAQALHAAGANVCVVGGSDPEALASALTELGADNSKTTGLLADITDEAAVTGAFDADTPGWAWVPAILLVDVAHVYATAFRVYFDRDELQRRPLLYFAVPLAGFVIASS